MSARPEPVEGRVVRTAWLAAIAIAMAIPATAHDLEKTQVSIVFSPDGSFVADVGNDPSWLTLRLESIPGPFADRVVFWVDGREIRPDSVEFIPPARPEPVEGRPAVHRLRGRVPMNARTLRWFYGLVIDPYPLTIRRADGRMVVEEVQGNAWSRTIDLSGQFHGQAIGSRVAGVSVVLLLLLPVALRFRSHVRQR
jgi:hypothetical protein